MSSFNIYFICACVCVCLMAFESLWTETATHEFVCLSLAYTRVYYSKNKGVVFFPSNCYTALYWTYKVRLTKKDCVRPRPNDVEPCAHTHKRTAFSGEKNARTVTTCVCLSARVARGVRRVCALCASKNVFSSVLRCVLLCSIDTYIFPVSATPHAVCFMCVCCPLYRPQPPNKWKSVQYFTLGVVRGCVCVCAFMCSRLPCSVRRISLRHWAVCRMYVERTYAYAICPWQRLWCRFTSAYRIVNKNVRAHVRTLSLCVCVQHVRVLAAFQSVCDRAYGTAKAHSTNTRRAL